MTTAREIPREFEALGYDVDALDENRVPWSFGAVYEDGGVRATWSRPFVEGWVLECEWELVDDTVQLEGIHVVRATPDAHHATAKMVAKLRLGDVYYQVRRLFRRPWLGFALPDAWQEAIERDGLGVPKPGRPDGELKLCAEWASKYDDARKRDPRRPVALLVRENPGETAAAIRARLTRARQLKLLTAAGSGRAGGHLTAKAKRVLTEGS